MAKRKNAQPGLRDHAAALGDAVGRLPQVVAAAGESEYLRAAAVTAFREAWLAGFPDGDIVSVRAGPGEKTRDLGDILRELAGGSLFAKEKLVVARGADRLLFPPRAATAEDGPGGKTGEREKNLLEWAANPAPRIWLLLETAQLPGNRTLGKRLAEAAHVVPCPNPTQRDIPPWLAERARKLGKRLDEEAADTLLRTHGTDLGVLAGEMEKLALFAGDGETIDADMVGEFLTGSVEYDIFGFTNAVEAKNLRAAVHYARRITQQGGRDQKGKREDGEKTAHRVVAMLAGTVRNLLLARVAMAARTPPADFAAAERLSPWRAERLYEAASRFGLRELRLMNSHVADQVRRTHDTGGDVALALETMAARFAGGEFGG